MHDLRGGRVTITIGEFLEIVGEHSDFGGYRAIRQRLFNESGGGRSEREFLELKVEVYLSAFLQEVGAPEGISKLHIRVLDPRFETA
jgi:hypothetical protein